MIHNETSFHQGQILSTTGTLATTLGQANPFRYRSYFYDTETNLYYLQSRYYDPNTGRFINADDTSVLNITQDELMGGNLYAYCYNNSVMKNDPTGLLIWPGQIHRLVQILACILLMARFNAYVKMEHYIKLGGSKFGFADLYMPSTKEIWEIKPNKSRYYTEGPKQLAKYITALQGKAGRGLNQIITFYYPDTLGIYIIEIYSVGNDGMIYYSYRYDTKSTAMVLMLALGIVLIFTGVGAPEGFAVGTAGLSLIGVH